MPLPFKITIREKRSHHIMERQPRYDVCVNGTPRGELYYNMTGYVGTIPTISGASFDPGEGGIGRFRKVARENNREAAIALTALELDSRRVVETRKTSSPLLMLAITDDGETRQACYIGRKALEMARELAPEIAQPGLGFFRDRDGLRPCVQYMPGDEALKAEFPEIPGRLMEGPEAELHERYIDARYPTDDPDVTLLISRRRIDDADPEVHFVENWKLRVAEIHLGDNLSLGDICPCPEVAVSDPGLRSLIAGTVTGAWLDGTPPDQREERRLALEDAWFAREIPDEEPVSLSLQHI